MNGYFEETNGNKYLKLFLTNVSEEKIRKYEELWSKIMNLISSVTKNSNLETQTQTLSTEGYIVQIPFVLAVDLYKVFRIYFFILDVILNMIFYFVYLETLIGFSY